MQALAVAAALTAAIVTLPMPVPAWAQNAQEGQQNQHNQQFKTGAKSGQMSGGELEQRLKQDLGKAGFTDIRVMPESFLVRARNAEGQPVMMVVNPDSITAVTQTGQGGPGSGQGAGDNGSRPGGQGSGGEGSGGSVGNGGASSNSQ